MVARQHIPTPAVRIPGNTNYHRFLCGFSPYRRINFTGPVAGIFLSDFIISCGIVIFAFVPPDLPKFSIIRRKCPDSRLEIPCYLGRRNLLKTHVFGRFAAGSRHFPGKA
jgi:hypothetical protein